ncbi:inositol-3-phosphate synthase [Nonomuraea sp. NPDC050310]|uniref:inositol-3-phosphate synthase n=1 Tax=unclassified Nonomuraea TaxID=2593643 RepID=UPI0033F74C04
MRIGIVGVGNCASSLVQGSFHLPEIRYTSAFDVTRDKVGRDLSEAIWAEPNNSRRFAEVPHLGVPVHAGPLADGFAPAPHAAGAGLEEVVAHLRESGTRILVNFLPTGSQRAAELYAEAALRAGCAFVNCMPAVLARSAGWAGRFEAAGLPLIGDDLKSSFGATLVQRAIVDALQRGGVRLSRAYQLLAGGNMDFRNLEDADRMRSKQATKATGAGFATHVGASYIPFLEDRKVAFIRIEGEGFGDSPVEVELRMVVEDSPSAAGNVLEAVRQADEALREGRGGLMGGELMKAPGS